MCWALVDIGKELPKMVVPFDTAFDNVFSYILIAPPPYQHLVLCVLSLSDFNLHLSDDP